jgi:demethylmenaquinone methyltransferase/2-methoxy-6-polyprenyl-1,4-benzoquinol methylase
VTEPGRDKTTHFGFRDVPEQDKQRLVAEVFRSVADKYDLMNDLMSFGVHRAWKQFAVGLSGIRSGHRVLDVAAGSGDLARKFSRLVGDSGLVVSTDISEAMLQRGRKRLTDAGIIGNVLYVQADAEHLPFRENYFHCISIGFGLRNVTRQQIALQAMYRCLRPGGRILILEFSRPTTKWLRKLYDLYSFNVLPQVGRWVVGDKASYQYLVESIRKQPTQAELQSMMETAGFERVDYHNLSGGIVAVHTGYKF